MEILLADPSIPHGDISIAFTPDEEIGRGANHFDVAKFAAQWAYTIDAARLESWSMRTSTPPLRRLFVME